MKLRQFSLFACLALVLGAAACSESPLAEGNGVPEAILATRSTTTQARNTAFSITAFTIDQNLKRIPGKLDAASAGAAVTIDSVVYFAELAETRVFMKTQNAATTGTTVTLTGHGLTKDVSVVVP